MKKLLIVPALLALVLAGCATLSNPKALAPLSHVGVVSVSSNAQIDWFGQKPSNGGLLGAAMNLASNNGKKPSGDASSFLSRADGLIGVANKDLLSAVSSAEGAGFVPESKVTGSAAYRAALGQTAEGIALLKPRPYKFVSRKNTTLENGLKSELGIDGDIFADFQFDKMMKAGVAHNGQMGAHVGLTVTVVDPSGKILFEKRYLVTSKKSIAVVAGVYDPKDLEGAFSQAIKTACSRFAADLTAG